jgi:hypothetical protein
VYQDAEQVAQSENFSYRNHPTQPPQDSHLDTGHTCQPVKIARPILTTPIVISLVDLLSQGVLIALFDFDDVELADFEDDMPCFA